MKRQTTYDKRCAILLMMDTVAHRYNNAKTHKASYTASQIAHELGYKSGNSVRKELYDLVNVGAIKMTAYAGKGATDCECWFSPVNANTPANLALWSME